ncbi:MAG: Mrp/NBP35 family ATP-binding protein [Acidobacteriota bacterium]
MAPSPEQIREALQQVTFPGLARDIVAFGFVESIEVDGGVVRIHLDIPSGSQEAVEKIAREAHAVASSVAGVQEVKLEVAAPLAQGARYRPSPAPPQAGQMAVSGGPRAPRPAAGAAPAAAMSRPPPLTQRDPIAGVRHLVAVASGKGGVGKSTVAVNLAAALSQIGQQVGLMDADIYGPSVPTMLGTHEEPEIVEVDGQRKIMPIEKFGLRLMSLGFLQPEDSPAIWRGPLVMKAVRQFLRDVDWRGSDILVIDLPPGTGDAQLTLTQSAPLGGAVIVTTPQDVALIDARKGLHMFREVEVPVLGIIENMSSYRCPECGHQAHIFKQGGGKRTAEELGVPLLGGVPIDPRVAECGDAGTPVVTRYPDSEVATVFRDIAAKVLAAIESTSQRPGNEATIESSVLH